MAFNLPIHLGFVYASWIPSSINLSTWSPKPQIHRTFRHLSTVKIYPSNLAATTYQRRMQLLFVPLYISKITILCNQMRRWKVLRNNTKRGILFFSKQLKLLSFIQSDCVTARGGHHLNTHRGREAEKW